jgi:hypothetical protein
MITATGFFQTMPTHLHQQPLLGVHADSFPWRDPKKRRIELIDSFDEAGSTHVLAQRSLGVRIKMSAEIPSVLRDLRDRLSTVSQQLPEAPRPRHPARKPTADPHDRDRLGGDPVLSHNDGVPSERCEHTSEAID